MPDYLIVPLIGAALVAVVLLPFLSRHRRREAASREAEAEALRYGLHEPVTLHPVIDPAGCILTGSCVDVCPEGEVFGLIDGRVKVIGPARCIGHGLCERSCPMDAIRLVFGTEKRGIEIPRIRENFETNIPGLYIVGELGGMGLVGNAFEQGRQCVEGILKKMRGGTPATGGPDLDLLIVGCGPAGLSASLTAQEAGLRFLTVEREDVGGTVRHYPRKKLVLTRPVKVPGYGKLNFREVTKEELIDTWEEIVGQTGLEVATGETVTAVARGNGAGVGFVVTTSTREIETRRLVLAIGRRGVPRKLGIPGEDLPKVAYSLREPESFQGDRILVVGGGDSAVEAALALVEQPGNEVRMSYRGESFRRIKPTNHERVEAAVAAGGLQILWHTNLVRIDPDTVTYRNGGAAARLPNDYTFIFAGGNLPTRFLDRHEIRETMKHSR
jgi:thioredoxin reductase/NAD-dependent dihydropyrimidine dehydrogenase PreA subunit